MSNRPDSEASDAPKPADVSNQTLSAAPSSSPPRSERVAERGASPVRDPGRYEILSEHGRGGLGRVSRAHDKDFGRDIAIKELLTRSHVNELRFVREAMITARLEHPGIVPVYESGRWPDGTPFYAMKLISGRSLRALIAERKTVDERIGLLHHVIAVADAIAYAHGRSIIHRDLKPANVIVGDFGETVVIDWGLAKDLSDSAELPRGNGSPMSEDGLTSAGAILGTPTYMAPEQERGEPVDQRADVFAIGAMLWDLCALQKVPPADLALRHRMLRRAGIDADLVTIIDKALAPLPANRYGDAGELAADLKAFKSGARIAARDYSLWAMLAHWTRRHRALALSVAALLALLVSGVVVFVRNVAAARDRADSALVRAQQERDRSKLSEAALVIDRDPNRAHDLLASFATRTPQVALLTSRARQLAAVRVIPLPTALAGMFRASGRAVVDLPTANGELVQLEPRTGLLTTVDVGLTEAFTYRHGLPVYGRQRRDPAGIEVVTGADQHSLPFEALESAKQIVALDKVTYVLGAGGDLHRFDGKAWSIIDSNIHGIAGDGDLLLICHRNGELEVERAGAVIRRHRCAQTNSPMAMTVVGADYAAVTDIGSLVVSRGATVLELPTGLTGEYELALSSRGLVGIADYVAGGRSWFVRPGSTRLEPGPIYASQTYDVAVDGDLVAWSYEDGAVVVRDTATDLRWDFHGHAGAVLFLVIDAANARVMSASRHELRIWDLKHAPTSLVAAMPCSVFHVELSPDHRTGALDCNDGGVRIWSRETGAVTQIQNHGGYSDGVRWFGDRLCSAAKGFGEVRCSNPDGSALEVLASHTKSADSLTVTADQHALLFASRGGKVWRFDRALRTLYTHHGRNVNLATSGDSRLLASCAEDGSLNVFDLHSERFIARTFAHAGEPCSVSWVGDELWSTGGEGTLKRWAVEAGELRLRHVVQAAGTLRLLAVLGRGWAAVEGASTLLVSRDGETVALRVDAGKGITALDVSADRRYVAASSNGEIIVIDLADHAIATSATGAPIVMVHFLEPALLAFSEPAALKTLRVDQLDYVPFVPVPEPANRASF